MGWEEDEPDTFDLAHGVSRGRRGRSHPKNCVHTDGDKVAAAMRFVLETLGEVDIMALWTDSAAIGDILHGQATS